MIKSIKISFLRRGSKDIRLVAAAAFLTYIGFGIYGASFNNFASDVVHMRPDQLGLLESLRETPGFLMAFVIALAMRVAEPKLGSAAMILMAVGFLGYSSTSSYAHLVAYSVLWSVGLHIWMPLQSAMALALSEEGQKGKRLGQIGSAAGLGTIIGIVMVLLIRQHLSFSAWYFIASCWMMAGAVTIWFVRRDLSPPNKPRLVWKRKYRLYYVLTFLEGCRKQVFITLAPFILVKVYHAPLGVMATLMLINNAVNLFGAPFIGKMIDRIGERKILTASYACLIPVFFGYALVKAPIALYVLYCLDNLLYLSTYGITTYLNRISDDGDLMANLSMGVTVNHLAAVAVPLVGGILWVKSGYQYTFVGGALVVMISLMLVQKMRCAKLST